MQSRITEELKRHAAIVQAAFFIAGLASFGMLTKKFALVGSDFNQDYFAAVAWTLGYDVYGPIITTLSQNYSGIGNIENFHPPTSGLFYIPFTLLPYHTAFTAWSLLSLFIYLRMIAKCLLEAGVPQALKGWVYALCLLWFPFSNCIGSGQSSILLAALIAETWWCHKSNQHWRAGICLGLACLLKPFPLILGLHFIFTRRISSVVAAFLTFVLGCLVSLYLFKPDAFYHYALVITKRDVAEWATYPLNISIWGLWRTLFTKNGWIISLSDSPRLADILTFASILIILAFLIRHGIKVARQQAPGQSLFHCLICGMLLISPIMWSHMLVILPLILSGWIPDSEEGRVRLLLLSLLMTSLSDVAVSRVLLSIFEEGIPWYLVPLVKINLIGVVIIMWGTIHSKKNSLLHSEK